MKPPIQCLRKRSPIRPAPGFP